MKHVTDAGALRAYLDHELPEAEAARIAAHLVDCARCGRALDEMRDTAGASLAGLSLLAEDESCPEPQVALHRFRARLAAEPVARGFWEQLRRSLAMTRRNAFTPRWRPLGIGATAILVLVLLFSIAPVREAAADFLGLFRVRKFAVIPLDEQQLARLEMLMQQAEGNFAEPQTLREPGPEQNATTAAQASALAGFTVRTPDRLPDGAILESFIVQLGPALHFEFDRAAVEMVLQAAGASVEGLPPADTIAFDVDVANLVIQEYRLAGGGIDEVFRGRLELLQVPSPQVDLPDGIDPIALARTGLLLLGMPAEDAERMANSIDWASTLVIPLPAKAATAREVTVDGVTGLLLEDVDGSQNGNALLWERDGILYFLSGTNLRDLSLLDAADSLR